MEIQKIIIAVFILSIIFCFASTARASDESWEDWAAFDGLPPDFQPIENVDFVDAGLARDALTNSPVKLLIKVRPGLRSPLLKHTQFYATAYSREYGPIRRERFKYNPKTGETKREPKGADIIELKKDGGDLYLAIDLHSLIIGSGKVIAGKRDFGQKHRICFAYQSPKEADIGGYLDIMATGNSIDVTLNDGEMGLE